MKKVISASIYQEIQFDNQDELTRYISNLERNHQMFKIESQREDGDKVIIRIMKQYNNNKFIERGKNGED